MMGQKINVNRVMLTFVLSANIRVFTSELKISEFVDSEDPVRVLTDTHVLEFGPECQVYKEHRATNTEIQQLCSGTVHHPASL